MLGVEEGGAVGRGTGRGGPYDGGRRQRTGQLARPVDQDPGGRQPARGDPEQVLQLRVGQGQGIGHGLVQQAQQRRPDPGGPAQREHGVDPGARAEPGGSRPRPQLTGVGDQGRIGEAVHLDDGGPGAPGAVLLGLVEELEGGQVEPERDPDAGVGAGRDLRGPVLYPGHPLRLPRGERRPGGDGRGRGAGQSVGDGVEERADHCLRFGQLERAAPGQGRRVPLVRQRGGDRAEVVDVGGVERSGPPGVDALGVRPGRSRPRAARVSACRAAVPQARVAGCAAGLWGAWASRGRAEATEKVTAGTVRLRTPSPCGRTTVSGAGLPASGRTSPSGAQKATRPSRGTAAGRKTAAWRSSAVACGSLLIAVPLPVGRVAVSLCRRV